MKRRIYRQNSVFSYLSTLLMVFLILMPSCKKFEDYDTVIKIVLPEELTFATLMLSHQDIARLSGDEGDVIEITIDWTEHPWPDLISRGKLMPIEIIQEEDPDCPFCVIDPNDPYIYYKNEIKIKPGRVYQWNPIAGDWKATGEKTEKKVTDNQPCIVGTWSRTNSCGTSSFTFNADGTATGRIPDCNGACAPAIWKYTWKSAGESSISLQASSFSACGQTKSVSNSGVESYICDGNSLTLGGRFTPEISQKKIG